MKALSLIILYSLRCSGYLVELHTQDNVNKRPVIGVLSQEPDNVLEFPKQNYTSYITASYVKNIEASGARVVPIMIRRDRSYYDTLLRKLNGVFLPGGSSSFDAQNGYADAGQYIYEISKEINDEGVYFPLFGVCLGFELIVVLAAGRDKKNILATCNSHQNLALHFDKDLRKSKMFAYAPGYIIDLLMHGYNTINVHDLCVRHKTFTRFDLSKEWFPTSYGYDEDGIRFISTIENIRYPIYGIQFHPEKVPYEWIPKHYVHSYSAIIANRYFMDFFVNECRKNLQKFISHADEIEHLIYNYDPIFTGKYNSCFEQAYMFEPRGSKGKCKSKVFFGLDLTPKVKSVR